MRKLGAFLFLLMLLWGGLFSERAAAQLPDLAVEFKGLPAAYPGEDITSKIEMTIKNTGGTDTRGFFVDIILKEPAGSEHLCARARVEHLGPKKSLRSQFDLRNPVFIPNDLRPGKYQLCVFADPSDMVRESREKNNRICHVITITAKD